MALAHLNWSRGLESRFSVCKSGAIVDRHYSFVMSATGAAEKVAARFDPVADYLAAAVFARRRQRVDGAFKAVEVMRNPVHHNLDWFVVFVSTNFTLHVFLSSGGIQRLYVSRIFLAPQTLAGGLDFLVVLRVGDAFIHQLFGEGLFVRCHHGFGHVPD